MKDIIKSLKDLGLEIVNSDSTATKDWLKTTAKLYEQLLLTDYLEKRNASLNAIEDELVERIGQVTDSTPIEIKQPEATSPVIESLGQEIREVPIPQGPPVSNIQESKKEEKELYYRFTNYHSPGVIYKFNADSRESELYWEPTIDFKSSDFESPIINILESSTGNSSIEFLINVRLINKSS